MAFFDGLNFFIALTIGLIPAIFFGIKGIKSKTYILCFSLAMIFAIFIPKPTELLYLFVYIFIEWHIIAIFQLLNKKFGKNKYVYYHAIILALLPLIISKLSGFIGHHWFSFIGISYITFRVIQIIIESYDGIIEKSNFWDTLNFLLFFPSLSSGPIDRSRRYESDLNVLKSREEYLDMLQIGIRKILLGVLYKVVFSAILFDQLGNIAGHYDPQYLILYSYIYGFYMFFDFAGYSLMAVGTGYILGIRVPDNFNKPFISIDMKDFWDRWHISLSHWFRDFVFSRYMIFAIKGKKFKNRLNAASAGFIVNMLVMGIWHGLSWDYIAYGLYHGVLLAVTERIQKKQWYKKNHSKLWFKLSSWFITLNLVMFGFLIFSGYLTETITNII